MSLPLLLALISTIGWSGFDAIRKKLVTELDLIAVGFWINALPFIGYVLVWVFYPIDIVWHDYWAPLAASVLINIVANLLFLYSIRVAPLSLVVPILSFTPVFSGLGAIPLLGEHLYWQQWLGAVAVSVGALVLSGSKTKGSVSDVQVRRGLGAMLIVSLCWAVTPIFDKIALGAASPAAHGTFLSALQAMAFAGIALKRGGISRLRPQKKSTWLWVFGAALSSFFALGLQLIAIGLMAVSVYEAIKRALTLVFALLSGALFFTEPLTRRKIGGAFCMALGVILVVLHQ